MVKIRLRRLGAKKAPFYHDFQYDMVNGGRRQIGSTIKPYLYSLAMIEGISPGDEMLHVQQRLTDENGRLWAPTQQFLFLYSDRFHQLPSL